MKNILKIYGLLTNTNRKQALILVMLMFVGMLLETLGVGLIIPIITVMLQDGLEVKNSLITYLNGWVGHLTQIQLVYISISILIFVYLVKNLFIAFLAWKQASFNFGTQADLSNRLYNIYLRQPYTFHLQRNSATLIQNISGEVSYFAGVITSSMMIFTELLVLIGIAILLFVVEPLGALIVVSVLGIVGFSFNRITRSYITKWGIARQYHSASLAQQLHQGLGGVKDVILLGRQSDFLFQYNLHVQKNTRISRFEFTLQNLPRLIFEFLVVCGLAILIFAMIQQKKSMVIIISTLGLFAAASFRLMPSISRILSALQTFRYSLPAVHTLHREFNLEHIAEQNYIPNAKKDFAGDLTLKAITFYYPEARRAALEDINLTIQKGDFVGIIGSSGSGKSTLVDVILGLLKPHSGTLLIDSRDLHQELREWQNQIGYVPQSIYLTDDTLRRNVAFGLPNEKIDDSAVQKAIQSAQLNEFISTLPNGLDTIVGERGVRLSGGQRQRIGIARALYHDPNVLVLDEATSALDDVTEHGVMQAVASLHGKKTIIIVAHRLSTIKSCDRLYKLDNGKIIMTGTPNQILNI